MTAVGITGLGKVTWRSGASAQAVGELSSIEWRLVVFTTLLNNIGLRLK